MKNVSISYNPYKLKTRITVDGKELAENSVLRERFAEGNRLQEWVEDLPDMLLNEFNDNKFAVSFHGTTMDYEDLKEVLDEAQKQHKFWYYLKWKKVQEAADKEKLIDEVFAEIQNGPFEELKSDEIKMAFQKAKSNEYAKTAQTRNIVDILIQALEELDYKKAKMQLERYKEERNEISRKIEKENKNLHNYEKVSIDAETALRKIVFDAEDTAEKIEMTYKKMLQKISVSEEKMSKDWQEKYSYFRWSFSEYMRENKVDIQKIMQDDVDTINQLFMNNMAKIEDLFENIKKEIRERAENESYRRMAEESGRLQKINFEINKIEEKLKWLTYIREKLNAILEI